MLPRQLISKVQYLTKKKDTVEIEEEKRDMTNANWKLWILGFEKSFKEHFCIKLENLNCVSDDSIKFAGYDN